MGMLLRPTGSGEGAKGRIPSTQSGRLGYAVRELLEGLRDLLPVSDGLIDAGKLLDKYYIIARYPNGFASRAPKDYFSEKEAENAISGAREIIRFCQDHLA